MSITAPTPPAAAPGELDPQGVVLRFLESVGRPTETRFYLDLFRAKPREQFAAIAIDANVMRGAADAVALDLRFLAALGLFPTVVFGLLNAASAPAHAARLGTALEAQGVHAVALSDGDTDLAGRTVDAARKGRVPIVAFAPVEGQTPAERFDRLGSLLGGTLTRKLIFLHRPGGLRRDGALIPLVSLSTDVAALLASRQLSRKETVILEQTRRLAFDLAGQNLVAAVTSPLNLLRELFTVKGAGTLVRKGSTISRHLRWDDVDRTSCGSWSRSRSPGRCSPTSSAGRCSRSTSPTSIAAPRWSRRRRSRPTCRSSR